MNKNSVKNKLSALLVAIIFSISAQVPALAQSVQQKKQQFINFIVPKATAVNQDILKQRHKLQSLYKQYQTKQPLSNSEQQWLTKLANSYQVKGSLQDNSTWQQLLSRVDIIPPSLVTAQAINESAWGSSRFAKQGNNYFGQWCYSKGCGLVPQHRPAGRVYEVKKYPSPKDSVASYIHNLNTNSTYRQLRALRAQDRQQGKPISGMQLATGLTQYSTRRQAYVDSIQQLIRQNNLAQYDDIS